MAKSKTPVKAQQPTIPRERSEFRKLLATNPELFAKGKSANQAAGGNTTFEELTCIGFNPALDLLEATVQIKRPNGYLGALCSPGSTEYVRFYIDYGGGWIDLGLGSFNAHDIPNSVDCFKDPDKPLTYVVTLAFTPSRRFCQFPVLPKVRAILSWNLAPAAGNANWPPPWGNVLDRHIQIRPRTLWFTDVIELIPKDSLLKLPPLFEEAKELPIPIPDPPPLGIADLAKLYSKKGQQAQAVEAHRFGFAQLKTMLASADQAMIASSAVEWKAAGFDLADLVAVLDKTKADVSYEQLDCLGLEYNLDRLVATFRIKRPSGYGGGLCYSGSKEYVAFWADWDDNCQWTYVNTVAVKVHDIPSIPAGGLVYSAILPVDLSNVRRPCGAPKVVRIRAVLSWNAPPSTTDPDDLTHWGNRLDAHVQIKPGAPGPGDNPVINIIGGIGVPDINIFGNGLTKPNAVFALGGSPADPWLLNRECPFGGLVIVHGPHVPNRKYRLWVREHGNALTEEVVKNPFHIVDDDGNGSWIAPNPATGYVTYMDTTVNFLGVLAHWHPPGDKLWQIRLEMATLAEVSVGTTVWHAIQSDNTGPRRRPADPPFEPPPVTCEIHIDSGGDCKDFTPPVTITGRFTARDTYFGAFTLSTLPSSMVPNQPTTPTPNTTQTATFAANGDPWSLITTNMDPCGYVVVLNVWDRSIVNSHPGSHNHNYFDVGFCLRSK